MPNAKEIKLMRNRPTLGVLTGWQFYHTATSLSYLEPIFNGISQAAHDLGCNLMLGCGMGATGSMNDPLCPAWPSDDADTNFVPVGPWNTDGLIITNPLLSNERSQYIQDLIQTGFPVLFVGAGEKGDAIVADNESGIEQAMIHLVEHGHKNIAFIAGSREDMRGDTGIRLNAYQKALLTHDLAADPALIAYGRHVFDGGYQAIQEIIASGHPFSAVMASNDESAMGAMQALKDSGRKVPEDVAVIGFDDRPQGVVQTPALTTVHVSLFNIGYRAVERMMDRFNGKLFDEAVASVPTNLVIRESCGCDQLHEAANTGPIENSEHLIEVVGATMFNLVNNLTESDCTSISVQDHLSGKGFGGNCKEFM